MSKRITNTSNIDPTTLFVEMMGGKGIEQQEVAGQIELINSTQLPVNITSDCKQELEAAGVVFGEITPGDKLFREVTLPEGWIKRPTNHSMWSDLVDNKGVVRAHIFYKAAFYDRNAFIRLA